MKSTIRQLVLVTWQDHTDHPSGWMDDHDIEPVVSVIRSSGFIVAENDDALVLASHWDTTGYNYSGITTILKNCIVDTKYLGDFDGD